MGTKDQDQDAPCPAVAGGPVDAGLVIRMPSIYQNGSKLWFFAAQSVLGTVRRPGTQRVGLCGSAENLREREQRKPRTRPRIQPVPYWFPSFEGRVEICNESTSHEVRAEGWLTVFTGH